jgi:hypothetical protein
MLLFDAEARAPFLKKKKGRVDTGKPTNTHLSCLTLSAWVRPIEICALVCMHTNYVA